jgi:hypothetical protein
MEAGMRWQVCVSALAVLLGGCFRCHHDDTDAGPSMDGGAADCVEGDTQCSLDELGVVACVGGKLLYTPCDAGDACFADAGGGIAGCAPRLCTPGSTYCDGQDVFSCNAAGTGGEKDKQCPPDLCWEGSCIAPCALATLRHEVTGCEYFAVDADNVSHDDPLQFEIVVSNPDAMENADVTVSTRAMDGSWAMVDFTSLAPGTAAILLLPDRHLEGSAVGVAGAYRVTSTLPVVAYQVSSADVSAGAASSGATLLVARGALGTSYYAMSRETSIGDDALIAFGAEVHHSGFAVVGTEDGTLVTVTASTSLLSATGIPALAAGDLWSTTVNAGDVVQLEGAAVGDDVTGSHVTADAPVAVIGYHECATITPGTCDHVEEMLFPTDAWGTSGGTYVCARTFDPDAAHVWRFLAVEDATTLTFTYGAGVSGLPSPSGATEMLDAGQWVEHAVTGPDSPTTPGAGNLGDFVVDADKPVSVVQFASGEVSMTVVGPSGFGARMFLFATPPPFASTITLARPTGTAVELDGAPIAAGSWMALSPTYDVHRGALADGTHLLDTGIDPYVGFPPPLGVYLSGAAGSAGWALVGGFGPRCYGGDDIVCP